MAYERPAQISVTARMLAAAGLLPQLFSLLLIATGVDGALGALMAFAYSNVVLSFIGGIWWGFAMRREEAQAPLAIVAVTPTLIGFAIVTARFAGMPASWGLVAIGSVLLLTLLVDRQLVAEGRAPPGWMGLRVPLSVGLGGLTILAGILAPTAVSLVYSN